MPDPRPDHEPRPVHKVQVGEHWIVEITWLGPNGLKHVERYTCPPRAVREIREKGWSEPDAAL